jgi:hypothetical protein
MIKRCAALHKRIFLYVSSDFVMLLILCMSHMEPGVARGDGDVRMTAVPAFIMLLQRCLGTLYRLTQLQ